MYATFISSYAGSNFDCTSMTNAELTAENRPAFLQVSNCGKNFWARETHENKSRVQVFVVLLHIVVVILTRLPLVGSVEVGPCIFGLDWGEEVAQCVLDADRLINKQRVPVRHASAPVGVYFDKITRSHILWWFAYVLSYG